MGFSAVAAIVAAGSAAYNADQQRSAAKKQAAQVAENARLAAEQAAETARGNSLAQQAAIDRQRADAVAAENARLAGAEMTAKPDVQIAAAADPAEAARRKTTRAQFSLDEAIMGGPSIRL